MEVLARGAEGAAAAGKVDAELTHPSDVGPGPPGVGADDAPRCGFGAAGAAARVVRTRLLMVPLGGEGDAEDAEEGSEREAP